MLLLATILVANPAIVFLLTQSLVTSVLIVSGCVLGMQMIASSGAPRIVAAYAFNFIALLSIVAHGEVVLLFAFPDRVIPNLYAIRDGYYFNRPFLNQSFTSDEYAVTYRTNRQGIRIGRFSEADHEVGKVDWLVLGDSFTQGAQVDFEDLFSSQLNRRFPDRVIVNAGISGFGIGHAYNYFVDQGRQHRPDLVILEVGSFNDFMNVEPQPPSFGERLMAHSAFLRLLLTGLLYADPADLPLGRWTEPFYPEAQANADYNIFFNRSSPKKAADLETFTRYLVDLKNAVEEQGARLLVVLLPTREQTDERYLSEVLAGFAIEPSALNMRRPNEFMASLARRLNLDLVDLLPAFHESRDALFFEHDEHLTALGHRVVAKAIAEHIERRTGRSDVTILSREMAGDRYPVMARDGSRISYQSAREGTTELFVADPLLRHPERLTFNAVDESHPMLSADGESIIFTTGSAESLQTDVVMMNLDGTERVVLTPAPLVFGAIPTFSPTSTKVAFAQWRYDERTRSYSNPQIAVLDLPSRTKQLLTSEDAESWRPVFSPDGTRLVYIKKVAGQFDLFLYNLSTGVEDRVTDTSFDEWDPQFSPDGAHVVYAAKKDDNWDLFLYEISRHQSRRLTQTTGDEWDPSVTPDGGTILFAGRFGFVEAIFSMPYPTSVLAP